MNDNINYSEYKEEKLGFPWARLFLGLVLLALVFTLTILFLRFCGKRTLADTLLSAGKKYYEKYPTDLPTEIGQCYMLDIEQLESKELIKASDFDTCDKTNSYVNVCFMESKNYHYSVVLECTNLKTNYELWQDGQESNVTDTTDVRFKFLGQELNTGTKYYYPTDLTDETKVNTYYTDSPSKDYTNEEASETGYKWYVEQSATFYWNNGAYSSTQPTGYPYKSESKTQTNITLTRPNSASYREIEEVTLYRYKKVAYPYKWLCGLSEPISGVETQILGDTLCLLRNDNYKQLITAYYTCDGINKEDDINKVCADYTDWSTEVCQNSTIKGIKCESTTGYVYTDTLWKWYKEGTEKYYYPSGSTDANKENTYYITSPVEGAIKDTSTQATVHKYYKLVMDDTNPNFEEWKDVTSTYVTEKELLETFNKLGYEVNSLSDIQKIDKIKYMLQLQYRNLK